MVSELPETTYAVLGLVDKLPGSSGYELVAVADRSFAHFWPISQTLLYKELNRLAELGWVVASRVERARSPTKSVYRSTPSGREALAGWLATMSQHTESFRSSWVLRSLNANQTNDFYELIVERHQRGSTVITSNRDPSEWIGVMSDPLLAQSAIDRLVASSYELVVEGQSYRRQQRPTLSR